MSRIVGVFTVIAVATFCASEVAYAAQPLLLIGQPPSVARLVESKGDGTLEFEIANKTRTLPRRDLVRWSNPHENLDQYEAILIDGSRLVLAESWTGKKALQVSADTVTLRTKTFGTSIIPRTKLKAILLNAPKDSAHRLRLRNQLLAPQAKNDRLELTNGDTLSGQLLEIGPNGPTIKFTFDSTSDPVLLPIDRVAGIALGSSSEPSAQGNLAIGLRDGSYLLANSLATKKDSLQIELACGVELQGDDLLGVVYLQSLGQRAVYLSDLEPTEYQHKPFLTIPWPYQRDRNLQGGPLAASQWIYPKGLAMHSASRLTYNLPAQSPGVAPPRRFAAQVAIDDSTDGQGSVVFQVFLHQAGASHLALATPIIRGGDPPLPISVDLGKAEQIELVVQYADRGDQGDHALWLDARLE